MKKRLLTAIALGTATMFALGGCASEGASASTLENGDKPDLTVGVFNGWPEGEAASYLWKAILDDKGYNVDLEYADAGPVFAALSKDDYDATFDVWLPNTHAKYMKQYGDKLVDLGAWNDEAALEIAVNKDAPIDSLDELAANADKFDNRIVGIEPGAGETGVVKDSVIPGYGLEKMDFVTSSTPAMLAELKKAIADGKNVAVTLWRPHWAYNAFPIKDLKDPKGKLGQAESIHTVARLGFKDDYPTLAGWLKDFKFDSDSLYSLENVMFNSGADAKEYPAIVKKWMGEHQEYVDGLTS